MAVWKARTALPVAASQIGCEGLGLLRNIILARILGPSEMGVFATLAITLSLLDMLSDLGPDRLLIQAEDGDREEFQATAQTLLVVRGMACCVLLVGLAMPTASLLGNPNLAWMIAALGAVAGLRGWLHLDCKRVQRNHDFRSTMVVELTSAGMTTAVVALFANHIHSASVFVWISLFQVVVLVCVSHVVATRRYRLAYRPEIASRLLRFGGPLACNSLIMFGALQGDRLVVLASATAANFGRYAVAFQLTMVPTLLISRITSTVFLPQLARNQKAPEKFAERLDQIVAVLGLLALSFTLSLMGTGNLAIEILYGSAFQVTPAVMYWLAIMQGLRILRAAPSLAALARADSVNPLASNVLRLTGIIAAATVGLSGWGLEAIVAAGCGGEVVALIGSALLLHRRQGIQPTAIWNSLSLFAAGAVFGWLTFAAGDSMVSRLGFTGLTGGILLVSILNFRRTTGFRYASTISTAVVETRAILTDKGI